MSKAYEEKRQQPRVGARGEISFHPPGQGGDPPTGALCNLSGRGMMFLAGEPPALESELEVTVRPADDATPPLRARVRVVRVARQRRGECYEVGAVIKEYLDD